MPSSQPAPPPRLGWWSYTWRLLIMLAISGVAWGVTRAQFPPGPDDTWFHAYWLLADPLLGVLAYVLVHRRRRWPLHIGIAVTTLSSVSTLAGGPAALALASVATRRRSREVAAMVVANLVSAYVLEALYPNEASAASPWWLNTILFVAVIAVIVAIGLAVGSRRELLVSLRERAETAEREQQARMASATAAERTRIAREMHDVLAHRISLVAMHAGALTYRTDLTPQQQADAAKTIETNAHQALQDLREVLGVLREDRPGAPPEPPQPGLDNVPSLVREIEELGVRVRYADTTVDRVPVAMGRTAYRVVQEGLTNARKHAPGTVVVVQVSGGMADGLSITVRNRRPVRPMSHDLPASGLGLLGLQERVSLAGGTLRHGTDDDGGFALAVWLPWPSVSK